MASLRLLCHPASRVSVLAVALLAIAARADDWQPLLGRSPFPEKAPVSLVEAAPDLEFRGIVEEDGRYFVNLHNSATGKSVWLARDMALPDLSFESYDAATGVLHVVQSGRRLALALKQAPVSLVEAEAAPSPDPEPDSTYRPLPRAEERRVVEIANLVRQRRGLPPLPGSTGR